MEPLTWHRPEGARGPCLGNEVQKTEHGALREQSPSQEVSQSSSVPLSAISTCWLGAGVTLSVIGDGVGVVFLSRSVVFFETPWGAWIWRQMASLWRPCELSPDCPLPEGTRLALCLGSGTVLAHIGTVLMAKSSLARVSHITSSVFCFRHDSHCSQVVLPKTLVIPATEPHLARAQA